MLVLFLGLAAGPAAAGPDVGARAPDGKSGDAGPKPGKGNEAKKRSGEGKKGPAGDGKATGQKPGKRPHPANASAHRGQGEGHKPNANGAANHADDDDESLTAWARRSEPADSSTTDADPAPTTAVPSTTTTAPPDPGRFVRALSSGAAGIATTFPSAPSAPAGTAASPPAAAPAADAPPPSDGVLGGALGPPLLGAGPTPTRWAPFVPALDEPAFPAILLAALAVFLALFGRGDRRDPKLVEAVVDDRAQDVDFS